jgi:hypothetical protein
MAPPNPSRVFISYARKDGADLAQRLQADLKQRGFDAWLDIQRLRPGAVWSTGIETEIDSREVTLALLSPGSYSSEICRAEQLRALDKGNRVIPSSPSSTPTAPSSSTPASISISPTPPITPVASTSSSPTSPATPLPLFPANTARPASPTSPPRPALPTTSTAPRPSAPSATRSLPRITASPSPSPPSPAWAASAKQFSPKP